jgi:NAD(P)-dependent dehydrogenase (short-subunit alcohol dehydrogenase family)
VVVDAGLFLETCIRPRIPKSGLFLTLEGGSAELFASESAQERRDSHIRVNCIIPGWIMTEKQLTEWVTAEAEEWIVRNQCRPDKVYPDDVARLLLWLAADDSR